MSVLPRLTRAASHPVWAFHTFSRWLTIIAFRTDTAHWMPCQRRLPRALQPAELLSQHPGVFPRLVAARGFDAADAAVPPDWGGVDELAATREAQTSPQARPPAE